MTPPSSKVRIDELSVFFRRNSQDGHRMEIRPARLVTAAVTPTLPLFDGWATGGELVVRASGFCQAEFSAHLSLSGTSLGPWSDAKIGDTAGPHQQFSIELAAPLRPLASRGSEPLPIDLGLDGGRVLRLLDLRILPLRSQGPQIVSVDLVEATDKLLVDGPERRLFDLQNPEEGTWAGTGRHRLLLHVQWASQGDVFTLDTRPAHVLHRWQRNNDETDLLFEDIARRGDGADATTEFSFDSSHPDIGEIPPEGKDVPLDLFVDHALTFEGHTAVLRWHAPLPLRVRNPVPLLRTFQRLPAVGIDFGTTATVAALHHKGYRSLLRLGNSNVSTSAENPTVLLIEDHERLWDAMQVDPHTHRFPDVLRLVLGSHAAQSKMAEFPSSVVGELKSLPERVVALDQSPQLRDRQYQKDFLLDERRVRLLIRTYAYLLGRAINRPGQDIYLHYFLTHPAKFDEKLRALLEDEIRAGILLSIPRAISAEHITVSMRASEPEAFAAEVCPELAASPALEPLLTAFGELRYAVFDFGGGTLDIACGRFRPTTEAEQAESGSSTAIETLQVGGDEHLGGDYLTHELVWLTHQYEKHLPEMEEKDVPMMRPTTVPSNSFANKPHLYKRSLAGRQNLVRMERGLALQEVKFTRKNAPKRVEELACSKLDGSEVKLTSLKSDVPGLHARLTEHLETRIRDGVRLLSSMLRNTTWGSEGDWRAQGVVILLAGNSSRSEFVERALAEELGIPDLKVWRPGSTAPFSQVVLYETPPRTDRGVAIDGVTPKTAVALGALKIANREGHLVRKTQGFSYFLGDLRGFPPKFVALIPLGVAPADPEVDGPHYVDFGTWDGSKPLRICKDYAPGQMTSNDPRVLLVPTGLPPGEKGRLKVCVVKPDEIALLLVRDGAEPLRATRSLSQHVL